MISSFPLEQQTIRKMNHELFEICFLKAKHEALSEINFIEYDKELIQFHKSANFEYKLDTSVKKDFVDLIIISSRTDCEFTQRLNTQIKELSLFKKVKHHI